MLMHSKMPESMKHSKSSSCRMCGGGECKYSDGGEVGVHEHSTEGPELGYKAKGDSAMSERGYHVRKGHLEHEDSDDRKYHHKEARKLSEDNLDKLKMMKKPNLKGLSHGGEVENDETEVLPDKGYGKIIRTGLADGGDVHEDEAQDKELIHDEMKDMMGEELMSALDAKDHKRTLETIEAIILNCLSKE